MEIINDSQSIKMFGNDCRIRGLSKYTIESYISTLNLFSKFLKKREYLLMTVDRNILREYISYLREREISQKTIENRFSAFSSLYDYAVYENLLEKNIVKEIRKRYLSPYKENGGSHRKLISVEEMSWFINSILDIRDKAISILFAKTGIRRRELVAIDLEDINWDVMSITLKPTHKRSNKVVYFDYETALVLKQWLRKREIIADAENKALFVSYIDKKKRLNRNGVAMPLLSGQQLQVCIIQIQIRSKIILHRIVAGIGLRPIYVGQECLESLLWNSEATKEILQWIFIIILTEKI